MLSLNIRLVILQKYKTPVVPDYLNDLINIQPSAIVVVVVVVLVKTDKNLTHGYWGDEGDCVNFD